MDVDPDPAVIAMIASSAANQEQADGPLTLGGCLFAFAVVFGVAGLTVWAVGAVTQMGIGR